MTEQYIEHKLKSTSDAVRNFMDWNSIRSVSRLRNSPHLRLHPDNWEKVTQLLTPEDDKLTVEIQKEATKYYSKEFDKKINDSFKSDDMLFENGEWYSRYLYKHVMTK